MGLLWILIGAALVAMIVYAARADWSARKSGQVLVPVKHGYGRRTTFVRMDRAELDEQKAAAIVAEQERLRAERSRMGDSVQTVKFFGGTSRRLRRR